MLSAEQRRLSSHLDQHLNEARWRALKAGLRWYWVINLIAILFLLTRFYIFRDAHLLLVNVLPWSYEWQLITMACVCLLLPMGWLWLSRQPHAVWQPSLWVCGLCWGMAWASVGYTISIVDLKGGFNLIFNMVSLLLIVLETGRRMLNNWFELAVSREHENLVLARKLDAMASRDPLTGLANRRHFDQICKSAIAQGTTLETPLTVILLDVDFFKRYNDHYGHQAGDECLILVAECLEESARESGDLVARYGGEEFVVLLQDTDLAGGERVAERIRHTLAARALPHEGSEVAPHLTLSQGIAQWRQGESLVMLLERVDGALYQAKGEGRNCYRLAA
ncbi:membrane-associated sensor domain-containing protein [Aeromonas sp. MR16]|uniref:GGDEF domain-containing protein n=1 Tax=Aeromonas sp. MR16 TaxID=2923420 RepID=UPI001F4A9DB0|nr:membrane-associated sensor domain-containing protein [Aeromonas sp. MR16]MCH7370541.1 membrane-associated sensor domain-containing protein [Aeromonas sp. MR16]